MNFRGRFPIALDKDQIKESLTLDDIRLILKDLGSSSPLTDRKGNLMFQTVCHSGHKHKLYYFEDSMNFHCFTECQESYDIYGLVEKIKKINFPEAVKYVANLTGRYFFSSNNTQSHMIDDWKWINRFKKKKKLIPELPVFNKNVLDVFMPHPHEDWLDEGISYETCKKFDIGYYIKNEQITIPHFNSNGELIGIRGRAMRTEDVDSGRKYMPMIIENVMYNHPTLFNLYGIHKTKGAIKRLRKAALFEAEKSVLMCEDFYGEDNFAVATCGGHISRFHRDLLLDLGVEEVFIAKDKEFEDSESEEAINYAEKLKETVSLFTPYVKTWVLFDKWGVLELKNSPSDKGKETLEFLMKNKFEVKTNGELIE